MYFIKEVEIFRRSDNKYYMVNLINGALDIIDEQLYNNILEGAFNKIDEETLLLLKQRKYLFESQKSYESYIEDLNKRVQKAENDAYPNFLLIPSYNCNLNCIYCYEHTYEMSCKNKERDLELIDEQYKIIDNIVKSHDIPAEKLENVRITIMGGEPLLIPNKQVVEKIINLAEEKGYTVDIVTNGIDLDSFINILKSKAVKAIQITLDGPKAIHDKRRIFFDGRGSFDKILKNLELALKNDINVFVRVNVDNENINHLTDLADLLFEKFQNRKNLHPYIYLLQDGGCSGESNVVKEEVGLQKIYDLQKNNANLQKFYVKSHVYPLINSIINNQPFNPRLKHCGASGNQFILDEKLLVYKCWHGIGNERFSVGKYSSKGLMINKELEERWINRDATKIGKCKNCKYRYICGTGCPAATHKKSDLMDTKLSFCSNYGELIKLSIYNYYGE